MAAKLAKTLFVVREGSDGGLAAHESEELAMYGALVGEEVQVAVYQLVEVKKRKLVVK